jgi:two-component sensor histidine kinase
MKKVPGKGNPKTGRGKGKPERVAPKTRVQGRERGRSAESREIRHRVINQLNLIYNILYFQKQFSLENCCADLLESAQKRIKAIALVYEHLDPEPGFDRVRFAGYCKGLLGEIMEGAGRAGKITVRTRIAPVSLDVATSVTCGLIVNELLQNALRHAFPGDRRGQVFFGLQERRDGSVAIKVSDDGIGLPSTIEWRRSGSMGSFLVNTLSENLKGELALDARAGTSFELCFHPAPNARAKE